jgi:predicted house-cleaning noncanonical NTP pyrophosphatase (MazG superfamily)
MMKLVRDRIPELYKDGKYDCVDCMDPDGDLLFQLLTTKLFEEAVELTQELASCADRQKLIAEIADVLEVIEGIRQACNIPPEELAKVQLDKRERRGGFTRGVVLIQH